jgi:hypothetical protein
VYIDKGDSLRVESTNCGIRGISSPEDSIQCFRDLGFSESCATIWYYNTKNTQEFCVDTCAAFFFANEPNNGPPPTCTIADCIQCDEVFSGPIFKQFAGRTRRSSGLLSSIARPCSEVLNVVQLDPCPESQSPVVTQAPSDSLGCQLGVSVLSVAAMSMTTFMLVMAG